MGVWELQVSGLRFRDEEFRVGGLQPSVRMLALWQCLSLRVQKPE